MGGKKRKSKAELEAERLAREEEERRLKEEEEKRLEEERLRREEEHRLWKLQCAKDRKKELRRLDVEFTDHKLLLDEAGSLSNASDIKEKELKDWNLFSGGYKSANIESISGLNDHVSFLMSQDSSSTPDSSTKSRSFDPYDLLNSSSMNVRDVEEKEESKFDLQKSQIEKKFLEVEAFLQLVSRIQVFQSQSIHPPPPPSLVSFHSSLAQTLKSKIVSTVEQGCFQSVKYGDELLNDKVRKKKLKFSFSF